MLQSLFFNQSENSSNMHVENIKYRYEIELIWVIGWLSKA